MVSTYAEFSELTVSQKQVLAWVHGNQRVFGWTLEAGTIYSKTMDYHVTAVENDGVALTDGGDVTPSSGEFFYDVPSKKLYINIGQDPVGDYIVVTYRLFFSHNGQNRPWDLSSGDDVHYEPLISSNSKFTNRLDGDVDQIGLSNVGSGTLKLINTSDYFGAIYDKIQFENGEVKIFSTGEDLPTSEIKTLYRGKIDSKSYSERDVSFRIKDSLTIINELIPLDLYSASDGDVSDSDIGTAKRRIYGEVSGARCVGLNKILEGFVLTGTFTAAAGSDTVTGAGSSLLTELTPGDVVQYQGAEEVLELTIKSITSATEFVTEDNLEEAMSSASVTAIPQRGIRSKNRTWRICGHVLKEPATTVDTGIDLNRFSVVSSADFFAGDFVKVGSQRKQIRRISGNTIVLETSLTTIPSGGTTVVKSPVQLVYLNNKALTFETDWTLTNTSEATIVLDSEAEVNVTPPKTGQGTISVTNGTRTITGSGTDFVRDFRPRDWVKFTGVSGFFEILQIDSETQMQLAASWAEVTQSGKTYQIKNVDFADDESIVTVQCLGITEDGTKTGVWVNTGAQVVKHILTEAGESSNLSTADFTVAQEDAPQRISLKVPVTYGTQSESIKEIVNVINKSIFGSLVLNNDYNFKYNVLSAKKPPATPTIKDDDILSWKVRTDSRKILNKVIVNYNFSDADPITAEPSNGVIEKTSDFVNRLIKTNRAESFNVHLFKDSEATIVAERIRFFREVSSSIITINSKLNFADNELNDAIYFQLDRIFERYGSNDQVKIGLINKIAKDGLSTLVEVNDLSGLYNRVANITSNSAVDFDDGSVDERTRAFNGYIVDNDTCLANTANPETFGINLIG